MRDGRRYPRAAHSMPHLPCPEPSSGGENIGAVRVPSVTPAANCEHQTLRPHPHPDSQRIKISMRSLPKVSRIVLRPENVRDSHHAIHRLPLIPDTKRKIPNFQGTDPEPTLNPPARIEPAQLSHRNLETAADGHQSQHPHSDPGRSGSHTR